MRAGPLSNPDVIDLLNRHFVPVYVSNEDYDEDGPAPPEERAERNRVWREAREAGLSSGTVHAYVLSPEGRVSDSRHVAEAAKVEETRAMLRRAVELFAVEPGEPLVEPAAQSCAPEVEPGGLVLHLTSRYLQVAEETLMPLSLEETGLGRTRNASWSAYAAENWVVYSSAEVAKLLPADAAIGSTWELDPDLTARLLVHFYPSTECNDPRRNRIDEQELQGDVVSLENGRARARLTGRLKMKHNFYPGREDGNFVEATLVGYLDFEPSTGRVHAFRLVTDDARYARHQFGVAVRSVP